MPPFGPIKRGDLIFYLRRAGFVGPDGRGKHQAMYRNELRVVIPNPHRSEVSKNLLAMILRQAGISREEWEKL
jgi:predicted RNA binding protein YcfA (HicA-like mRNA interferase family)